MADVSDVQVSAEQAARQARRLGFWARVVLVPVAVIGAVLSFRSLYQAAVPTFGDYLAGGFPLLVDLLILGASLQYVAGAKIGRPMAGWRLTAHAGVGGTLILNALAAKELGEIPWHITAPAVWAVLVELTAKQVLGEWKATHAAKADKISFPLWMTAPVESVRTRLLMFRTGITDAHKARIAVGVNAAAREALRLALPRRNARRVRKIINRQLRAGSLTPAAILRPLGWTKGGTVLQNARPDVILQAVLQEVLDPDAAPAPLTATVPPARFQAPPAPPTDGNVVHPRLETALDPRTGQYVGVDPRGQVGPLGVQQPDIQYVGAQPAGSQPGVQYVGVQQSGVQQPGVAFVGAQQGGAQQPGVQYVGAQQPGVPQAGVPQPGIQYVGAQSGAAQPGVQQPGVQQPGLDRPFVTAQPGVTPQFVAPHTGSIPLPVTTQHQAAQQQAAQQQAAMQQAALQQAAQQQEAAMRQSAFLPQGGQQLPGLAPVQDTPGPGVPLAPGQMQQPDRALQFGQAMHRRRTLQEAGPGDSNGSGPAEQLQELLRTEQGHHPTQVNETFVAPTAAFSAEQARYAASEQVRYATAPPVANRYDDEILEDTDHLDELDGQEYPAEYDAVQYLDADDPSRQAGTVPLPNDNAEGIRRGLAEARPL
jgi:hypothetical protein